MAYFSALSQKLIGNVHARGSAGCAQLPSSRHALTSLSLSTSTSNSFLARGVRLTTQRDATSRVSLVVTARRGGGGRRGGGRGGRGGRGRGGRGMNDRKDGTAINEMIRVPEVRLVGVDKEMIGITDTRDAMDQAAELGMDLVMINKDADPPVCRLMDYKKFTYDQGKKDKEAKKKQRNLRVDVKELKLRYNIDTHDYEVRKKAARKFLSAGDKVKFLCQFRGREMEFKDIAFKMFEKLRTELADVGTMEGNRPNLEGRTMVMFMGPTKTKAATIQAQEQEEKAAKRAAQKAAKKAQIAAERAAAGLDAEEDDDDDDLDNSVDEGVDESVDEGVDTSVDEGVDASIDMDGDEKPEDNASVVNVEETVAPVRPNAFPSLSRPKPPGAA
ncbi:hypothetical protein CYMTET_55707 [Cymbomonas tetramitiformis]|uniref:Translation initiation factor IF-3 n=1 Tax=Cymbomonas tetramitiformis TaxID=36881 RepID=A0AAE0EMJ6_9CHLO|nr:hypothetical protein CYMTET_55707 [Cymbomonas tetramitiformis]